MPDDTYESGTATPILRDSASGQINDEKGNLVPVQSRVVSKAADYVAVTGDVVLEDATAANRNVTLPAPVAGASITVKKIEAGANTVTLTPTGGQIDGAGTYVIAGGARGGVRVVSDGVNWFAVSKF